MSLAIPKILQTKINFIDTNKIVTKTFNSFVIDFSSISSSVPLHSRPEESCHKEVRDSVLKDGLWNPGIVIKNTLETHTHAMQGLPSKYLTKFDNTKPWLLLVGCQRMKILLDAGYTSSYFVECTNWQECVLLSKKFDQLWRARQKFS